MQSETDNTKQVKVFITGATGYIGGTTLNKLLESHKDWKITALTRSESTVDTFKDLGVLPLVGTLDDSELLTKAASEADVVLHLAHADHMSAVKALIKGCSAPGKRRIYIHCSGTGALIEDARGAYASDKIYSDLDMESINAIPLTNMHRDVDTYLFDNSKELDLIIVAPPTIHGIGTGPFNRLSQQIPRMIRCFAKYGHAATSGKGLNIWNNVHVEDLGDFFVLLVEKALEGKASTGKDGWYFCENGEHQQKDIVAKIGSELYKHGLIKQVEPVEFKPEEVTEYLGASGWLVIASNSRCRADRARELGWKPNEARGTVYDSIEKEVEAIFAEKISKAKNE